MPGPNDRLDISPAGVALIADFEGFRGELYDDAAGHCTIGYGHLVHKGGITAADRAGPFGKGITREAGLALLHDDAQQKVAAVRKAVTVPLEQNQFDALVSFTFNVGAGALAGSTLLKKLNAGDYAGAAGEFGKWTKAGGKELAGLVRRREAEADMFRGGPAPAAGAGAAAPKSWCNRLLKPGCRGDDVKEAQRRLGIPADGVFGPKTEAAVRAFQQQKKLGVDGKIGPKTAAVL